MGKKIVVKKEAIVESPDRAKFAAFIEEYKKKHPVKYEMKKVALEQQLAQLK